jgi:hypothetical protein
MIIDTEQGKERRLNTLFFFFFFFFFILFLRPRTDPAYLHRPGTQYYPLLLLRLSFLPDLVRFFPLMSCYLRYQHLSR